MLKTIDPKKLWIPVFCTGSAASAASAAITGPSARGRCRLLAWVDAGPWIGALPAPWFGAVPAPWFRGIAGSLVSGHCRPLGSGQCRPLDRGDAGSWFQGIHPNCFEIQD